MKLHRSYLLKEQQKRLRPDSVTIVGARDVSDEGIRITRSLSGELVDKGINIVSGYAEGVDLEAHLGALEAGGTTTIVLSDGIKQLRQKSAFKKFNWERDILTVSQFDPDTKWSAWNSLERNQLVCALSKAVVVIESGPERDTQGKMSGTFITAKAALDLNLPVFVVNPNCLDNAPKGNADLIALGGYSLNLADWCEVLSLSESLLTLNQFELMRSLFHTDESAVDCYVTQFAFPISTPTRFITEKQRVVFPITEIALCSIANMGKFTVNIAVDVPLKITDDDVRRFP